MKNPVIIRVERSYPPILRCMVIFCATIICIFIIVSCYKSTRGRIEQKFNEYVEKNLANPSDLVGIASIELEDSVDMREFCEFYLTSFCPDSIEPKITEQMELASVLAKKAPKWFKESNKESIVELLKSDAAFLRLGPKWEYLKEEYKKVDSLNLVQRMYLIKARIKEDGKVSMKNFYAIDYMIVDSVIISDKKIPHKDSPREVLDLTNALESYMEDVRIKMDYLQRFINLNNKLQQVAL